MRAVILSVGDELALGQTLDTNSAWIAQMLVRHGVWPAYHLTLPDDRAAIAAALRQAATQADLIIVTGGLGPTEDDLTRHALADAMGVALVEHAPSLAALHDFFAQRGRAMPDANRRQALHPAGSRVIPNTCGTAPGIDAVLGRARVIVTPGVPREMQAMFQAAILPLLASGSGSVILTTAIHTFGLGESDLAQRLGPLMDRHRNPTVGTTVAGGIVTVRVRSQSPHSLSAQSALDATVADVERRLAPFAFGRDEATLAGAVVSELKTRGQTLATAESCTGGLLGTMLTDVPGASAVYLGGWVTYSAQLKHAQLGVPENVLADHGEVSQQVVQAMASGASAASGADYALAITGIAGPTGGTPQKPVGTVWLGLAKRDARGATSTQSWLLRAVGADRQSIRDRSAKTALQALRLTLLGHPVDSMAWIARTSTGW